MHSFTEAIVFELQSNTIPFTINIKSTPARYSPITAAKLSPQYYTPSYSYPAPVGSPRTTPTHITNTVYNRPRTPNMSPTAFKDTLATLLLTITKCHDLCLSIRANRHLPSRTSALDTLQASIFDSVQDLQVEYNALRRAIGSRMDLGDESSRSGLVRASRELEGIKQRLTDVAYRRDDNDAPGFRELDSRLKTAIKEIRYIIEALGRRLTSSLPTPSPAPGSRPNADEVTIKIKELHRLSEHMRNSWIEQIVSGRVCYVNCVDERRITFERPEGFVKFLPTTSRTGSWDRISPEAARRQKRDSLSGW